MFEEVRQQVDDEMRVLLANLKAMVAAEAAAKSGARAAAAGLIDWGPLIGLCVEGGVDM